MERGTLKKKQLVTDKDRLELLDGEKLIVVDNPARMVSRIFLNTPANGNLMNNRMRAQLLQQLQLNDQNPDVRVTIICGSGDDFCAGIEPQLSSADATPLPFYTNDTDGQIQRNTLDMWFMMQDMAKPIISQVHGRCLGIGADLASACDLVYVSNNSVIGYSEIRNHGLPDYQIYPWLMGMRNALSVMLLAETMSGQEAVTKGWATGCCNEKELMTYCLSKAERVAKIPGDLLAYNKRSVYRAFEMQGMRTNLRHSVDLQALMWHAPSANILRKAEQRVKPSQIKQNPASMKQETSPRTTVSSEEKLERGKEMEQSIEETSLVSGDMNEDVFSVISRQSGFDYLLENVNVDIHINEPVKFHIHQEEKQTSKL